MEVIYSTYYKGLSGDVKERYEEKIQKIGCDPYVIKKKELSVDPKNFPEITLMDIGEYLIHSVSSFTKKKFSAYKSTEAYKHFESGFVLDIGSKKHKEYAILKGRVKHGQKMNEPPLHVWVLAKMTGNIECCHCTCIAGLSESCSHVGAICYAVANLWESNETKSVTDFLCKWNVPSFKEESMGFVSNIRFRPRSSDRPALESTFLEYCNALTPFSDESIETFIKQCQSEGNSTAIGSILFPEEVRKTGINDDLFLASLFNVCNQKKTRRELIEMGKSVSIELSSDKANEISCLTQTSHKSKCRFALQRGRIIASNFMDCCNANLENPSISLINRVMNPINYFTYPKYAIAKKKKALDQHFRSNYGEHKELEQYECGLIINPKLPYFAASPDILITCDCHGEGCVVIKFLKIMESSETFDVLCREPNRILNKNEDFYELDKTHDFYYQVQLQINVAEIRYCDLVIWSPKPNLSQLVVRVYADFDFWKLNMEKALKYHQLIVMPEVLGKSYSRTGNISEEDIIKSKRASRASKDALPLEISPSSLFETKTTHEKLSENQFQFTNNNKDSEHFDSFTKIDDYNTRNLMKESIESILLTFADCEDELKTLYNDQIKQSKRNYKSKDLPDMVALDIVTEQQFKAMADLVESRFVNNLGEEHNSTDIIFDAVIPEWTILIFCKTFKLTRFDALETLRLQSRTVNISESDLLNI